MFELFRKKRIERYTKEAEEYVCSTYAPLPHQNEPNIRYSLRKLDREIKYSDREYKPARDTALALAISLQLSLQQTNDLLARAGYALSHSNKRDVIIEYFIREGIHCLSDINEVLYKLNQKTIGR